MSVLSLENVTKRDRRGLRELVVLRSVSLSIETGEVVCITGARRSGRTSLLRIAAGVDAPVEGRVLLAGIDLHTAPNDLKRQLVFASSRFIPPLGADVLEQVMAPLYSLGVSRRQATLQAHRALERVGAADLALSPPEALVPSEMLRVVLARAIVREPRVMLLDEPINGLDPMDRDPLLQLIQRLAHDSGIAVLVTAGETTSVTGADRVLLLTQGELLGRTAPASGDVVELRRPSAELSP